MFSDSLPTSVISTENVGRTGRQDRSVGGLASRHDQYSGEVTPVTVQLFPSNAVTRRAVVCRGVTVEIIQATRPDRIEYGFCGPVHMLVLYKEDVRDRGETFVQGVRRSTPLDLRKKLTFVPAGHAYRECQELRGPSRLGYFYFDPAKMPIQGQAGSAPAPRLYFENAAVWDTALKLISSIESASDDNQLYLEALGVVLAHELGRIDSAKPPVQAPIRGGLAAWQQRVAATYIEEHLTEQISLTMLARLVRLSPFHFCRAFKQSFGMPPNRYHTSRRIELAKILLAKPTASVTEIGLTLGFSQTSSFSAAFRRTTGLTPTSYHRALAAA